MICKVCGSNIPDNSKFCPVCGAALGNQNLNNFGKQFNYQNENIGSSNYSQNNLGNRNYNNRQPMHDNSSSVYGSNNYGNGYNSNANYMSDISSGFNRATENVNQVLNNLTGYDGRNIISFKQLFSDVFK
ncbi:MAG: zinc ribbon domain-containing protein, partial [Lachnospiraceae bacterium]|nr:zinc ribbon domain-containing protein [Lachnospiraceae bacterium]